MNQKQRDLLCKMLTKRAEKLKSELVSQFFLLTKGYGGRTTCCLENYRLDLSDKPKILARISSKQRKTYEKLQKEQNAIDERKKVFRNTIDEREKVFRNAIDESEKVFRKAIDALKEELCEEGEKQKKLLRVANQKLIEVTETSIVEIQFAEGAEQAQQILSGLPSVEDLIG